jgi:hypothetical protein
MRRARGTVTRSQQLSQRLRLHWRLLATLALSVPSPAAAQLSAALPHTFHRGPPPGPAAMPGVDGSRAHRAQSLPSPAQVQVLWERQLSAGIGANLVVDAAGSVFVVSPGRVTQFAADGSEQYVRQADFTSGVAVSLLANGVRVLLTRAGRLLSWSADGTPQFQVALTAPSRYAHASLLALPQGGVLAHLGNSLFRLGASGEFEGFAELEREAVETLVDGDSVWLVASDGELWTWNGRDPPALRGSFPSQVSAAALGAPGRLLAVVDARELVTWSAPAGPPVTLAQLEGLGSAPRISAPGGELIHVLDSSGHLLSVRAGEPSVPPAPTSAPDRLSERQRLSAGMGAVLASADGSVAWLAPGAPLTLRHAEEPPYVLSNVICHQPLSLVPAGGKRLVASCTSGQVWMIGPSATTDPPRAPAPHSKDAVR